MTETRRENWLWEALRKRVRRLEDVDQIETALVKGPTEKRKFAGDPNQPSYLWVRTRNR